jgi:hypothetical protein
MATDLPSTEPNLGAPFIPIPGVPNLRDIGGYPTTTGSTIKKGLVYRAAAPHDIPEEGFQQLTELGWKTVFDLRSNTEIEKAAKAGSGGVVEIPGAERVFNPVFADEDYSPQTLAVRFANYASGTPEVGQSNITLMCPSHGKGDAIQDMIPKRPLRTNR